MNVMYLHIYCSGCHLLEITSSTRAPSTMRKAGVEVIMKRMMHARRTQRVCATLPVVFLTLSFYTNAKWWAHHSSTRHASP
jgi:hypothetical protein